MPMVYRTRPDLLTKDYTTRNICCDFALVLLKVHGTGGRDQTKFVWLAAGRSCNRCG